MVRCSASELSCQLMRRAARTPERLTSPVRDHKIVTMGLPKHVAAGEFKAKCLALLDHVASTKQELIVTKRGRPVARVVPLAPASSAPLEGLIVYQGDLVSPIDIEWDAAKRTATRRGRRRSR